VVDELRKLISARKPSPLNMRGGTKAGFVVDELRKLISARKPELKGGEEKVARFFFMFSHYSGP
jgi:hypothetical protein